MERNRFNATCRFCLTNALQRLNFSVMRLFRNITAVQTLFVFLLLAFLSGCVSSKREADFLKNLNNRLIRLESRSGGISKKLNELDSDISNLKGREAENRKSVEELESRMDELSQQRSKTRKNVSSAGVKSKSAISPGSTYKKALYLFNNGRLDESEKLFNKLADKYPGHNLADNALYWIGEIYYTRKDYEKASAQFKDLIARYPDGNKVPDALIKMAVTQSRLGNDKEAEKILVRIINRYRDSEYSKKARKKLKALYLKRDLEKR